MPDEFRALTVDGSWIKRGGPNRWWKGTATNVDAYALLVTVALPEVIFWAKSRTIGARLDVALHLHDLDRDATRAQVMFSVGDGWCHDAIVALPRPDYLPPAIFPTSVRENVWTELFRVEADPPASVGVLAIPRTFVKMGRTGVWRSRELSVDVVPELLPALQAGRKDTLVRQSAA
jgi:hypothetical protein